MYGTKVTLYFKDKNTYYQEMFRFTCTQARTIPNLLMVGGKSNLKDRKWATFYMDRGRAEGLLGAITIFSDRREKFLMDFSNRMGERVTPGGRDWSPDMSDAEATLDCDDKLELEFDTPM